MSRRDEIYLRMLDFALVTMRNYAQDWPAGYCVVEADHVHNLPSLVGETNEARHVYYLRDERAIYLERVDRTRPGIDFLLARYEELWTELEALLKEGC
jgi:hypothetical protein